MAHCGRFGHFICSTKFHIYNIIIWSNVVFVVSPDDGRLCRPKPVVYVRSNLMLERLWCCIGRTAKQDVN